MTNVNRIVLCSAALLVALACGRAPELIDRTEPNYFRKADLLSGTWYIQDTIVDVPPTSPATAIGFGGNLEKVRFEIQENHLVAYRTYEWVPGLDPLVDREKSAIGKIVTIDGKPYRGAPVAAWRIVKHFDRQRQYNPATGEQSNILVEDTQDRPWYEREYIRVNWAANDIVNYLDGHPGDWSGTQLVKWVTPQDQRLDEDALVTDYREVNGKKELYYFDVTLRAYVEPPRIYYPGYGALPYCWLNPRVDCESAEIQVRTSVLKVDEAHVQDYEPLVYGDRLMKKFGFFRTERVSYDRNRGATETGRILYANRHNIWKQAHEVSGTCNAASDCAEGFACEYNLCRRPIPVEKREVKPIVYYLTPNFPKELLPAVKQIEQSWDYAFRRAVAVPRGIEVSQAPQMFYICETPVPEGAPEACGKRGLSVRLGDLRYNQIPWIDQPQLSGPLGLGPSAADPETGEIIQGVANIYGAGLDQAAGEAHLVLDVLNGDLSIEDLIDGKQVQAYVFEHLNPTDPRRPLSGPWQGSGGLNSEPQKNLGSFGRLTPELQAKFDALVKKGLPRASQDRRRVVDQLIAQSPALETELIGAPEVRNAVLSMVPNAEFRKKLESDPALYRQVARQTLLHTGELVKLERERIKWASQMPRNGCLYLKEFADDQLLGLAHAMKKVYEQKLQEAKSQGKSDVEAKRIARDQVWLELRRAFFRAVTEHEIGHTVGLTHNFAGSFDALNYKDGYWDLRKDTIGVLVGGQRVLPTAPQNLLDASKPNERQIEGQMSEYQYSSIMDYGSRINSDVHGIGKYDNAAILFGYAGGGEPGWVEVFAETRREYDTPNVSVQTDNMAKKLIVRGAHMEYPLAQVEHFTPVSPFITDRFHYTTLPFQFADRVLVDSNRFADALEQGIQRMHNRTFRKWSQLEAIYEEIEKELHAWNLRYGGWGSPDWDKARDVVGAVRNRLPPAQKEIPVEVPYMYCSDYEVGANPVCYRWDHGADIYEITRDWITRYQEYYVFNAFRRDRLAAAFGPSAYANRLLRYMGELPNVYQQWLFNIYWYQYYYRLTSEQLEEYLGVGDPVYQNYWTMAVIDSTNLLLQTFSTPAAGYHGKTASGAWVWVPDNRPDNTRLPTALEAQQIAAWKNKYGYSDVVYVPRGPGRSMYTQYDSEGMEFAYRVNEVGHFWDQLVALFAITASETNFLGVDRGADALRYSLPYYMTFNRELATTFTDIWTENRSSYGPGLIKTGNGLATVVPRTFIRGEDYIDGFNYPPQPVTPVDGNGNSLPVERIEPTPTWSTRFYAEVYGMAYFTENFNQEYASYNQVFRLGSGESITPSDNYTLESVADPFGGGYQYAALRPTAVTDPAKMPAAPRMVVLARTYKSKWDQAKATNARVDGLTASEWEAKTREVVRSLEIMRGLYNIFGQAW